MNIQTGKIILIIFCTLIIAGLISSLTPSDNQIHNKDNSNVTYLKQYCQYSELSLHKPFTKQELDNIIFDYIKKSNIDNVKNIQVFKDKTNTVSSFVLIYDSNNNIFIVKINRYLTF